MASRVLGRSLRRVSADWEAAYGHRLELAETFVDPARFHGGAYDASNWVRVGRTKGFARHNGAYTDPHAVPKEMFVRPLRVDARKRLADPVEREEWTCRATPVRYTREELRSLRELFAEMPDCRRGQGILTPSSPWVRPTPAHPSKLALLPALTSLLVTPSGPTSRPIPFLPPEPSSQSLSQSGSDLQREITLGVSVTPSGRSYRK